LARHGLVRVLRPVAPALWRQDGPAQPAARGRRSAEGCGDRPGDPHRPQRRRGQSHPLPGFLTPGRPKRGRTLAMPPTLQRTFSRNLSDYLAVAAEVERFCADNGLPKAVTFKVRLVLEELVLNLIDHVTGSVTDRIDVRIELEGGRVTLVVED